MSAGNSAGISADRRHRGRPSLALALALLAAVALVATGVVLLRNGLRHTDPDAAPLPPAPYSLPASAASAAGTAPAAPPPAPVANRIYIPALGVDAPLVSTALAGTALVIPHDVRTIGLWSGGGQLDADQGTVLAVGHVNDVDQGNGALWRLASAPPLTDVWTTDSTGSAQHWRTVAVTTVLKAALPTDIFDAAGPRRLVLVTCGGAVHNGNYDRNVLVEAVPVPDTTQGG